jgi:ubiquinone/menaquinone biosynthesis C-methylase UbiE
LVPSALTSSASPPPVPWYLQEEVTSTYETWYEGKYKKAELQEKALLKKGLEWIGDVKTVLEVGCGTAHFTRWFEEMGIDACGMDISPFMLSEAKRLWRGDALVRSSSSDIPCRAKVVDAVGFITCFEYMPDPVNVIREASKVARRGVFFGLMNSWSIPTIRRKIQLALGKNPYYRTAHFYSLPRMRELLRIGLGMDGYAVFSRSAVFPRAVLVKESRLPFGAFLCVSVRFEA